MLTTMKNSVKVIMTIFLSSHVEAVSTTRTYLRNNRLLEEKSSCNVDVQFGECPKPIPIDNGCQNPFQVVTFRYNGGDCMQSNNFLQRHEFTCDDMIGGPPTSSVQDGSVTPVTNYIVVTSRSGNETYFAGNVSVGDEYTLNADEKYSVLIGDMTISIYETQEGNLLQKTNLLLDCTNQLFLFDSFGASQVVYWKENDGREVQIPDHTQIGNIAVTVNNPDDSSIIRLVEMTLIGNMQNEPVDYTPEVQDVILQQQQAITLNDFQFQYEYGVNRTRYTFFTTIIAENLDGSEQCNDYAVLECVL